MLCFTHFANCWEKFFSTFDIFKNILIYFHFFLETIFFFTIHLFPSLTAWFCTWFIYFHTVILHTHLIWIFFCFSYMFFPPQDFCLHVGHVVLFMTYDSHNVMCFLGVISVILYVSVRLWWSGGHVLTSCSS